MTHRFRSLRTRLLLPILSVAILSALAVAVFSYWLGDRWARREIATHYRGIARTLSGASFPLNRQVVQLLAGLTDTDLITLDAAGSPISASIEFREEIATIANAPPESDVAPDGLVSIGGQTYRFAVFPRSGIVSARDRVDRVAVLFDEEELRAARMRAAVLPLATGLSTIFLLASVTLYLSGKLVTRLARLQREVNRIAEGNFDAEIQVGTDDEIGLLGTAVKEMSGQLQQIWQTLHRQEGQKLLHQIAGGLAHQLRNSITGARMAVELHSAHCTSKDDDALPMALGQLEQTDDYVRRLLLVAAGKQDEDRPGSAGQCIADIQSNLEATAAHLHVRLNWHVDEAVHSQQVADTPSLAAAVTNLALNAMQASTEVDVRVTNSRPGEIRIDVTDNGAGPPESIADDLFEPFVSSKPEGLGLGLPLVKRSAERLDGRVEWNREGGRTHFVMFAATAN